MENPKISLWITSTGRYEFLKISLDSLLEKCKYPNLEILVFESVPTEESRKYFDTPLIKTDACIEYVKSLKENGAPITHWVEPWIPWGNVLQRMLMYTDAPYSITIDDDCLCACDPTAQWLDEIEIIKDNPSLLGFRNDLSNPSVDTSDKRFTGVKAHPISNYLFWPRSGGAVLYDNAKLKSNPLGGYITDHALPAYNIVEQQMDAIMRRDNTYIGVMLKYYGSFVHIGHTEVTGRDRKWSSDLYLDMYSNGYYGLRNKE